MDQQTVELMCLLQAGIHDAETWARIEALLPTQRRLLAAADKPAELADLRDLLETWSGAAPPPLSAAAALQAGVISEEELEQDERAIELYQRSLDLERTEFAPWHRLEGLLERRGEPDRLEAILAAQAEAMRVRPDIDAGLTSNAYQRLGQLRLEHGRLDEAIAAYEQALELAADSETLSELAQAYCARGGDEDRRQAADLYSALGDVLGAEEGVAMLERALDLDPTHDDALDLLEAAIPENEQAAQLLGRWKAYVAHSSNAQGVEARRERIAGARALAGSGVSNLGASSSGTSNSGTSNGTSPHVPPASAEPAEGSRAWNPKTLLGMGVPALVQQAAEEGRAPTAPLTAEPRVRAEPRLNADPRLNAAPRRVQAPAMQAPEPAGRHAGLKVPPLFSGRPSSRADEPTGEQDSDWPEQLRLATPGAHAPSTTSPSFPPMLRNSATRVAEENGETTAEQQPEPSGASGLLLSSSPPSYAFGNLGAGEGQPPRGLGRWVALLGGAAILGISAGVAIAYGLRAHSAPTPRASSAVQPAVVPAEPALPATAPAPSAGAEPSAVPSTAAPAPVAAGKPSAASGRADGPSADVVPLPPPAAPPAPRAPAHSAPADAGEVKVAAKQLKVRGGLTAKEVAATLDRGLSEIESCYDGALAQKATLRGTLRLGWSIDRAGKPSRLKKLGGTLKDATVERCSLDTIRDLQFPASKKRPTHVIAPLAFQTRTGS